jgi:hypothetical protein
VLSKEAFAAYVKRGEEKALSIGSNPDGGYLGACPSNSRCFCWRGKRESDSVLSHEQDIPRLED